MFRTQAGRTYAPNTKCFATYKVRNSLIECVTHVETTIPPEIPVEMTIPPEIPVEMTIPPEIPGMNLSCNKCALSLLVLIFFSLISAHWLYYSTCFCVWRKCLFYHSKKRREYCIQRIIYH